MLTPSREWKESILPGESERFERLGEALREMQRRNAKGGVTRRALHAVPQLGLAAELAISAEVPAYAKIGIFAEPKTYRTYVRYSNGAGSPQSDRKPAVRGIGVKVVGVPGRKLIPGLEDAKTQDFLLIHTRSVSFRNAEEFVGFVTASTNPIRVVRWLLSNFGLRRSVRFLREGVPKLSAPIPSLATTAYDTALPLKYGPYAVHFSLSPHATAEPGGRAGRSPSYLKEDLEARLAKGPIVYDFRAQFFCDEARTPIEDPTREWSEQDSPYVTLGQLTIPGQDPASPRARRLAERVERMSFDPWHATEDFRPLGNLMRARAVAYRLSTQARGAAPEPDGSEDLDGSPDGASVTASTGSRS